MSAASDEVRRLLPGALDRVGRAVRLRLANVAKRDAEGAPVAEQPSHLLAEMPDNDRHPGAACSGQLAQQLRDDGLPVDGQHRLRVPLRERAQPGAQTGGHDHGGDHARSERRRTSPRRRAGRPSPCRITRSSERSSRRVAVAGGRARLGRAEARFRQRRGERMRVDAELVAHKLVQLCRGGTGADDQPLVDQEVRELASARQRPAAAGRGSGSGSVAARAWPRRSRRRLTSTSPSRSDTVRTPPRLLPPTRPACCRSGAAPSAPAAGRARWHRLCWRRVAGRMHPLRHPR